jgi:hypothetical protein
MEGTCSDPYSELCGFPNDVYPKGIIRGPLVGIPMGTVEKGESLGEPLSDGILQLVPAVVSDTQKAPDYLKLSRWRGPT